MDKKVKAGVAAAVVAAGVGVNQIVEPSELTHEVRDPAHTQIEEHVQMQPEETVVAAYTEERRMSRTDRVRAFFLRLPAAVKAVFLLPLWCIGAVPGALAAALGPVWGSLLGLAAQLALLAGLFALVYKLLFPHKKLRELFRKKNLKWLALAALLLTAVNVLLGELWAGWPVLRAVLLLAAGYLALWLLCRRLLGALRPPAPEKVRTELKLEY